LKDKIEVFKESPTLGGFSIAVRDDWSFKIKRIHISIVEKEAFVKEFGSKIMLEQDFMKWWLHFRQQSNSDSTD